MQGGFVRRLLLVTFALMASLFLAPTAGAQEMMQEKMMDESMMMEKKGKIEMPKTGGPATLSMLLLAAATLLLGSGVLTYAVLRRR
jgi:LPXTG-motif cell wall-anchored protein